MRRGLLFVGVGGLAVAGAVAFAAPQPGPVRPPGREINPALAKLCGGVGRLAAEGDKSLFDKAGGLFSKGVKVVGSTVGDKFTVEGKGGPYVCRPKIAAQVVANNAIRATVAEEVRKAKAAGKPPPARSLFAAEAGVSGRLQPSLVNMPRTQEKLQRIVDDIATAWPYPGMPRVEVLIDATLGYNAQARADDTIVVWLGALTIEGGEVNSDLSDRELYWLLGHEYAHLALGHMLTEESGESQRRLLHNMANVYQRGAMLGSSIDFAEPALDAKSTDLRASCDDARSAHRHLRFLMDSVAYPAWKRTQEDEADAAGMDLAYLAGVQPAPYYSVTRFGASEVDLDKRLAGVQANMTQRAEKVINDPAFKAALERGSFAEAHLGVFESLKKGLYEGLRKWFTETFSREHRSASNRTDGLSKYKKGAFEGLLPTAPPLLGPDGRPPRGWAGELVDLKELSDGLAGARAVRDAQTAMEALPTNKEEASRQIGIALKGLLKDEPYVRFTAHEIALLHGRKAEAIQHLEVATRPGQRYPSPQAYKELVRLYATSGQMQKARETVTRGRSKITDSDYFLSSDIRILVRSRQLDGVEALLAKCRATDREQIMLDCQEAVLDGDYSKLSEAEQKKLNDLALWGGEPKKQRAPTVPSGVPGIPSLPWKRGG